MIPPAVSAPRVVWSELLGDYLVVTKVEDDGAWEFVPLRWVMKLIPMKASAPLSSMPSSAP